MIESKKSILAKHLFFDDAYSDRFDLDLKFEVNRQKFLAEYCFFDVQYFDSYQEARRAEASLEKQNEHRYLGTVRRYENQSYSE